MIMIERELNHVEKLALATTGIEGTGEHFVMNGESAENILLREKQEKFNNQVDEYVDRFDQYKQQMEDYAKSISEDMNGLEIMPMFNYALIQPFEQNPFQQIKKTKSGIITDLGGMNIGHHSNETGEFEEDAPFIKVGTVIEVGHKCEFLQPGDVVFYTVASECIVPFFKQGFVVVAEPRIIAVVNSELTKRRNELKNGNN